MRVFGGVEKSSRQGGFPRSLTGANSWPARFAHAFSRLKLGQQLALLVLATALPLVLSSLFMFNRMVANEREKIVQGLFVGAKTLAGLVEREIDTHAAIAFTLSNSPALADNRLDEFRREAIEALEFVPGSWINLTAPDGRIVMSTLRPANSPLPLGPQGDVVTRAFATGRFQVGDLMTSPINGKTSAKLEMPVFKDGKPFYSISISLVPARFLTLVNDAFTHGEVVGIIDRNSRFVARIPEHEKRVGTLASEGWRKAIAELPTGWTENHSVEGRRIINAYAQTKYGWVAGVAYFETDIQSPLTAILRTSLGGFAMLAAVSLLLAFLGTKQITSGMTRLTAAARAMGEGAVLEEVEPPFHEARTLSDAMVKASNELRMRKEEVDAVNAGLEVQVERRTAELVAEIQQREQAETDLRQAQKMEAIGQLTGGIAHDFNNMLTIIIGNLDTLQRRLKSLDDPSKFATPIEAAMQGARSAAKLTHRLLAFARRQSLEPVTLSVNSLINSLSDLLTRTVGENIRVETVLGAGLWSATADANQLESSLVNLAVNARDAMPDGGKLTIETANAFLDEKYVSQFTDVPPGQYVMVSVTDTGAGIPPAQLGRVFEPFFTTKPSGKGTGLGLAMVHGFVKQSGGHIRLYSETGSGTTVKIYLPKTENGSVTSAYPKKAGGTDEDTPLPRARPGETILLVEDNDGVRNYAVSALKDLGYKVLVAANDGDALKLAEKASRLDLLFTDIVLGESKSGDQLAAEIAKRRPELPVLFMTGYSRNAITQNSQVTAATRLLTKPFTQRDLARKIRALLDASMPTFPLAVKMSPEATDGGV